MIMIDVRNLTFSYNKKSKKVLDNLNVCFKKGTINVLLGLNGSGKTTLIKIIAGLLDSYNGEIYFEDKNVKEINIREYAKKLSYVSQKSNHIDDFLVRDYLLFGNINKLKFYQSPNKNDEYKVEKMAEKLEILHLLDKKMNEISGGERQTVAICCSLIQNTDIIVLDEPTSALDVKNQYKILSILKELANKEGKTIILSSHNPNHALYLESVVYLLKDGKIFDSGLAKNVITLDKLKTIYGENIVYSNDLPYKEISFN